MCGANIEFNPLNNICEFLTAVHIYADEAKQGKTRHVDAVHYCSHVRKDLRQCLIYDSHEKDARLIGVEYMVPREVYLTFPEEEQKLWHSHEYEVKSGMLILPKPEGKSDREWEAVELEAMNEIVGLYGKTWHFWEVDAGHQYPLGRMILASVVGKGTNIGSGLPNLMGSAKNSEQLDLDVVMSKRNQTFAVHHATKAVARKDIEAPQIHPCKLDDLLEVSRKITEHYSQWRIHGGLLVNSTLK